MEISKKIKGGLRKDIFCKKTDHQIVKMLILIRLIKFFNKKRCKFYKIHIFKHLAHPNICPMDTSFIESKLSSQFHKDLFSASLANLNAPHNKLSFNNFAFSIRELTREFLHSTAPDQNIVKCSWYKQEGGRLCQSCKEPINDGTPTRSQRIRYAIQGGISDSILETLGFDVKTKNKTIKGVLSAYETLNKYTHINIKAFDLSPTEVRDQSDVVLETLSAFLRSIEDLRQELINFLEDQIQNTMVTDIMTGYLDSLEEVAPHYYLDDCEVYDYKVQEINESQIIVQVYGTVDVTLHWGSSRDGIDVERNFPYEAKIRYEISEDFPEEYEIDPYGIDTSSWFDSIDDRE